MKADYFSTVLSIISILWGLLGAPIFHHATFPDSWNYDAVIYLGIPITFVSTVAYLLAKRAWVRLLSGICLCLSVLFTMWIVLSAMKVL